MFYNLQFIEHIDCKGNHCQLDSRTLSLSGGPKSIPCTYLLHGFKSLLLWTQCTTHSSFKWCQQSICVYFTVAEAEILFACSWIAFFSRKVNSSMTSQHVSDQLCAFFVRDGAVVPRAFLLWLHLRLAHWRIAPEYTDIRRIRDTIDTALSSWQAVACPQSGLDRKVGTSSWNQEVRRHATSRAPLRAQWRMTNLVSSDRTRSVFYTALSPCVGGQIKATLIHNREALLNSAGAAIKIERAMLRRGRMCIRKTEKQKSGRQKEILGDVSHKTNLVTPTY